MSDFIFSTKKARKPEELQTLQSSWTLDSFDSGDEDAFENVILADDVSPGHSFFLDGMRRKKENVQNPNTFNDDKKSHIFSFNLSNKLLVIFSEF